MITPEDSAFDLGLRINRLRKEGNLGGAVDLALEAMSRWPDDVNVLRAYAWCRYDREIKPALNNGDARQLAAAEAAARWVAEQRLSPIGLSYETFDPTPIVVLQTVRGLVAAARFDSAVSLLEMLDPARLSHVSRDEQFDPPRTDWFRMLSKSLAEQHRWSELIELSKSPLRASLTGKHVRWVEYRFSTAFLRQGQPQEALAGIERALAGKTDAWVQVLRAEVMAELGRTEDAIQLLRLALASTRNDADLGFQVSGLIQIAKLLNHTDPALAGVHVRILVRVRESNGWPIKQVDRDVAAEVGSEVVRATDDEVLAARSWWTSAARAQRITGRVKTVLPHGGAGFVTADSGEDYYFAMPRNGKTRAPAEGARVSFLLIDGFDRKRNCATKQATQLRPHSGS
jgi:tetratricopeptide (TPR) repeat protein/cold shock CspA family protein